MNPKTEEDFEQHEVKTYMRVGWCCYCGKQHVIKAYRKDAPQLSLNNKAFFSCDCSDAVDAREEREKLRKELFAQGKIELAKAL